MKARLNSAWGKLLALLIGLGLALVLGEITSAIYGYMRFSTFSVATLYQLQQTNAFLRDIERTGNSYAATLFPHPYLGFVHRNGYGLDINNIGLLGTDFPYERDPGKFVLLVTGGSVASQFAQLKRDGIRYLEDILNARYDFGGKQVVVLNGGDGAWKQPQQAILLLLYIDVVDAVITIDGFNEHYTFMGNSKRLELPNSNFHQINPLASRGFESLAAAWFSYKLRSIMTNNWLLSHSYLGWLFSHSLTAALRQATSPSIPEDRQVTTIESIFSLPDDWDEERSFRYNAEQYRKYIRLMHAMSSRAGRRAVFFLQPVPAIGKTLTAEEQRVVGDLGYRDTYLRLTKEVLALRAEGIPVHDLSNVFLGTSDTIYADAIHCVRYGTLNESKGYQLMSEAVAAVLEKEWNLRSRSKTAP